MVLTSRPREKHDLHLAALGRPSIGATGPRGLGPKVRVGTICMS